MKALVRRAGGIAVDEVPDPVRTHSDDVLVAITVAGMCRTDIYVASGRLRVREPLILGHEFTGVVLEGGYEADFRPGDRVTAIPLLSCRACRGCLDGGLCARPHFLGVEVDGAFAEQIVLPARNLRKVGPSIEPRRAAYAEPVAAAMAVLNAPLPRTGRGLVLGENRIATLTERILHDAGFDLIERSSVAHSSSFADQMDFVIETEANEVSLQVMLEALKPGGIAVLKSRPPVRVPLNIALAVRKDVTLHSVSYAPFEDAIALIERGTVQLDDLLGPTFALEQFEDAISVSDGCSAVKSFFRITER